MSQYGRPGSVEGRVTTEGGAMSKLPYRYSQDELVDLSVVAAAKMKSEC